MGIGMVMGMEGLLTGHVDALGVPNLSNIDFTRANSLPSAPASNNVHSSCSSLLMPVGRFLPAITISATTHPAAHKSISHS